MDTPDSFSQDIMQVCLNGHVITDLLRTNPDRGLSHCDRCGAVTLDGCLTCGQPLRVVYVPGLVPVGERKPPPCCSFCGAQFPWSRASTPLPQDYLAALENLLRRLPLVIRQLRSRHGNRLPFRVDDGYDLEDLLRALLPLHFDDVRTESRTPSYSVGTRTDFLLGAEAVAIVLKHITPALRERDLAEQWPEDIAYYTRQRPSGILIGFVYDAEGRLPNPRQLEKSWSGQQGEIEVRCLIAT